MTSKPSKFLMSLLGLLLCLILVLSGCSGKKTEKQDTENETKKTENETHQGQAENERENDSSKQENNPYSFIPKFEEQVIYDKGGIKLSAIYDSNGADPDMDFNYVMYCKIENNTKQIVELLPDFIVTKDGFKLNTVSLFSEIEPGQSATDRISFNPTLLFSDKSGSDTLFQEYGLASTLGDFRLDFKILDADTGEHIIVDSTDYINTEKADVAYNYNQLLNKEAILDQNGIKIHFLDHFILPPDEGAFVSSTYYCILTYYENQNEEEYLLNLEWPKVNGKDFDVMLPSWSFDGASKGFDIMRFDIDTLKEKGFESIENLEFNLRASKLTDKEKRRFEEVFVKENMLLKLSSDWKTREIKQ